MASVEAYTDFLLLGKTGMGKSTTADRLLLANAEEPGALDVRPIAKEGGHLLLDDIQIWRIGNADVDDVKSRVKCFLLNRVVKETVVDPQNKGPDSKTRDCVLLSNERTKVRVLDVPGFHTSATSHHPDHVANQDNVGIMRQILRIQAVKKIYFNRILYFLPNRGPPERADANFQEELRIMYHFFGRVIFNSMLAVTTIRPKKSTIDAFDEEDKKDTRDVLDRAFQLALAEDGQNPDEVHDIPQPPIVYLPLNESSSDLLARLQGTRVRNRGGLELQLVENTCSRCGLKFAFHQTPNIVERLVSVGDNSEYDQSHCHPLIKPKYSRVQKFFGGVAHIMTLGIAKLAGSRMPGFFNHDEDCAKCGGPPGSPGCVKVGEKWLLAGTEITVDHASELDTVVETEL